MGKVGLLGRGDELRYATPLGSLFSARVTTQDQEFAKGKFLTLGCDSRDSQQPQRGCVSQRAFYCSQHHNISDNFTLNVGIHPCTFSV